MNSKIIGAVIIGAVLLLLYVIAKPAPTHKRFTPGGPEDAEMARVIRENWKLGIQQEKMNEMFDKQREENAKSALDKM